MFERLAGKLLSRLLSKYFVSDNESSTSHHLLPRRVRRSECGVVMCLLKAWNCAKKLSIRILKSKGLPFELLQCTLGRVEITVPWAKLGLSSPSSYCGGDDAVVVVVVVDGVHALLRTNYEFDDEALREAAIRQRRQELQDAQDFGKQLSEKKRPIRLDCRAFCKNDLPKESSRMCWKSFTFMFEMFMYDWKMCNLIQ